MKSFGIHKIYVNKNFSFTLPNRLFDFYKSDSLVLMRSQYTSCLNIYSYQYFEELIEKVKGYEEPLGRMMLRELVAWAYDVNKGDRIKSEGLFSYAQLRSGDYAILIDSYNRIELMSRRIYRQEVSSRLPIILTNEQKTAAYNYEENIVKYIQEKRQRKGNKQSVLTGAFISHSSHDTKFAQKVATDLEIIGADPFIDLWEIKPGDSIIEKVQNGIDACDIFIIILSENSVNSIWCRNELNMALTNQFNKKDTKIIPIKYRECTIPGFLRDKLYIDMTDSRKYKAGISSLLETLRISELK